MSGRGCDRCNHMDGCKTGSCGQPTLYVTQACNGVLTPFEEVKVLDIAFDEEDRDIVTFHCSDCGCPHDSSISNSED